MKRKLIIYLCNLIIILCLTVVAVFIAQEMFSNYQFYINLYENLEQDVQLLESAYYFGVRIYMSACFVLIIFTIISSIINWVFKYHSFKVMLIYLVAAIIVGALIIAINLTIATRVSVYKWAMAINIFLSVTLVIAYSLSSYVSSRKLIKNKQIKIIN